MNRRELLLAGGVMVSSALAGCTGGADDEDDTETNAGNGDGTGESDEGTDGDESQPDDESTGGDGTGDADRPASQTLSGSGDATESVDLADGLTVVESEHEGSDRFRVDFRDSDGAIASFADGSGTYEGAKANLLEADTYTAEVTADGAWRLEVRQPRATADEAAEPTQSFEGDGPDVVGPIAFDGSHTATGVHEGEEWFQVRVFPAQGATEDVVNVISSPDTYEGTEQFEYDGVGWIDVYADGHWSLELE